MLSDFRPLFLERALYRNLQSLICWEAISDADWSGGRESRRSPPPGNILLNGLHGQLLYSSFRVQKAVAFAMGSNDDVELKLTGQRSGKRHPEQAGQWKGETSFRKVFVAAGKGQRWVHQPWRCWNKVEHRRPRHEVPQQAKDSFAFEFAGHS